MDKPTGLALLRQPFPPNQISKLPKPKSKDAPKGRCNECGGWHGLPAVHLDYVGHAALTDRLLDADPMWAWEPMAISADGLPVLDGYGGMWIRLTVCGHTRLGYGHAGDKQGGDAIKEVIGDAMRNAAMRFGAALDLWHKGELHKDDDEPKAEPGGMPVAVLTDWLSAIDAATPGDELDGTAREGMASAEKARDREAYIAIREAAKKRRATATKEHA